MERKESRGLHYTIDIRIQQQRSNEKIRLSSFRKTEEEKPYSNKDKDDKRNLFPFPARG